jgi:hypothetical protein
MARDKDDDLGFSSEDFDLQPALRIAVAGRSGSGKGYFSCSGREPIHYISLDPNAKGTVNKWRKRGKDIRYREFQFPEFDPKRKAGSYNTVERDAEAQSAAFDTWMEIKELITKLIRIKTEGTIVIDTASSLRQLQTLGYFGKLVQIPQNMWTIPNAEWEALMRRFERAQAKGVSTILIHKLREERIDKVMEVVENGKEIMKEVSEKTGRWERDGYKRMEYLVDAEVHVFMDPTVEVDEKDEDTLADRFGIEVIKCHERPSLTGRKWLGRSKSGIVYASLPWVGSRVFPETKTKDWK